MDIEVDIEEVGAEVVVVVVVVDMDNQVGMVNSSRGVEDIIKEVRADRVSMVDMDNQEEEEGIRVVVVVDIEVEVDIGKVMINKEEQLADNFVHLEIT